MPIESLSFWFLMIVSFLPLIILGFSSIYTRLYRKKGKTKHTILVSDSLPIMVRLYGASIRTVKTSLCVYLGSVFFMFGLPALILWLWYPLDFIEYLGLLPFWILFWCVSVLIFVGSVSPDSTGGLGQTQESEFQFKDDNHSD